MPIRAFLSGQAMEPEVITEISAALERVCADLGVQMTAIDPAAQTVAKTIIALAERGFRKADDLHREALAVLKHA